MKQALLLYSLCAIAQAQESSARDVVNDLYRRTQAAMREAKTNADLVALVDGIDTADWVSITPTGFTLTRTEAVRYLEEILTMPPEKRATEKLDVLWIHEEPWRITAVVWVYGEYEVLDERGELGPKGEKHRVMSGSLVRDTFSRTSQGWRRIRHEKIFPNRRLMVDGKAVLLPAASPAPEK